jgi:hypothetical protein
VGSPVLMILIEPYARHFRRGIEDTLEEAQWRFKNTYEAAPFKGHPSIQRSPRHQCQSVAPRSMPWCQHDVRH